MLSLKNIMRMNALSCLLFGSLFVIKAEQVVIFLGGNSPAPVELILITGIILILNGAHLSWASNITLPQKHLVLYFSGGDFIWVIISLGLIGSNIWITTTSGIFATGAVALMVGFFGVMQMIKRKQMGHC